MSDYQDLTANQRRAVEHHEGPLQVLAGPGSGKTRVITRRIVRLVERGVRPENLLAITFTNKAAAEMAGRVRDALPGCRIWVSTFHSFCARLLRQRAEFVGLQPNFSILDTGDQKTLIRQVLHELDIDAVHYPPGRIAQRISRAKNDLVTTEQFAARFQDSVGDHVQAVVARVYPAYQQSLLNANCLDFDDLLLHVVTLLTENPELRSELDRRFSYLLVDEYQDTNAAQYQIVRALSQDDRNVCVTGDPDQSIYGWRGARIDNILRFESDYPDATLVRLEENFRSTKAILQAADSLIAHNTRRKAKNLLTENSDGAPVALQCYRDGKREAEGLARQIRDEVDAGRRSWSDFAVIYRVNALSREVELALARHRIPYQLAGGVGFYERAEVKDLLAYLRLIENPADRTAFQRIVNTPRRGIGKTTQSHLQSWASQQGLNFLEAARQADSIPRLSKRGSAALQRFAAMRDRFSLSDAGSVERLLQMILDETGYTRSLAGEDDEDERLANIDELLTAARQYDLSEAEDLSLEGFLEAASLASETDNLDETAGRVTLMTLHAAKGLEFPVVYILAVEENLIPHERSLQQDDLRELEEERRLLFVGMTRAQQRLALTQTEMRAIRGRLMHTIPSSFLSEMELTFEDYTGEEFAPESRLAELPSAESEDPFSRRERPASSQDGRRPNEAAVTTGADLLNGTAEEAQLPQGFAVGMTVRHPRYGLGTVVDVQGPTRRRTVTVEFADDDRRATFSAAHCPLQPVGRG